MRFTAAIHIFREIQAYLRIFCTCISAYMWMCAVETFFAFHENYTSFIFIKSIMQKNGICIRWTQTHTHTPPTAVVKYIMLCVEAFHFSYIFLKSLCRKAIILGICLKKHRSSFNFRVLATRNICNRIVYIC